MIWLWLEIIKSKNVINHRVGCWFTTLLAMIRRSLPVCRHRAHSSAIALRMYAAAENFALGPHVIELQGLVRGGSLAVVVHYNMSMLVLLFAFPLWYRLWREKSPRVMTILCFVYLSTRGCFLRSGGLQRTPVIWALGTPTQAAEGGDSGRGLIPQGGWEQCNG